MCRAPMPRYTPYPADAISSSLAFDEGWGGGGSLSARFCQAQQEVVCDSLAGQLPSLSYVDEVRC